MFSILFALDTLRPYSSSEYEALSVIKHERVVNSLILNGVPKTQALMILEDAQSGNRFHCASNYFHGTPESFLEKNWRDSLKLECKDKVFLKELGKYFLTMIRHYQNQDIDRARDYFIEFYYHNRNGALYLADFLNPGLLQHIADRVEGKNNSFYQKITSKLKEVFESYTIEGDENIGHNLVQRGIFYANGWGLPKDEAMAFKCFQEAAEHNIATAFYNLGVFYFRGNVVEKNMDKAFEYFQKAAEGNYAPAQYNLGLCYLNGMGVEVNIEASTKYFQRAAEAGYAKAQNNLGAAYFEGNGVEKSLEQAIVYFQKAAVQGNPDAQNNLGVCYMYGYGIQKDFQEANKWFGKAAAKGFEDAQFNLIKLRAKWTWS